MSYVPQAAAGEMTASQSSGDFSNDDNCCVKTLVDPEQMQGALVAIAQEMQSFQMSSKDDEELFSKLTRLRTNITKKNNAIKRLKKNIKIACYLAKSVISEKETETVLLNQHLKTARSEAAILTMETRLRDDILQRLTIEAKVLQERVQHFRKFIASGYQELQKMRNQPYEEIPAAMQLKNIIFSCGQYYADYSNEHTKCLQLEQRNRFLMNKIHVLEANLESTSSELVNCQRRERNSSPKQSGNLLPDAITRSRNQLKKSNECVSKLGSFCNIASKNFVVSDLSSHLGLVKSLLDDQDKMLKDLRELSVEFS